MSPHDQEPLINKNESLQTYYGSLESRIGYRFVLGGTRHFGYYPPGTYWPFPISKSLRAMEDNLIHTLNLEKGSKVLDAGCGAGYVAVHLAEKGYRVHGIDVVDHHVEKATRNAKSKGLQSQITISKGDYHHLDVFADGSFDGAYTMETFVHATDPEIAAAEFYRVLRPGGSMAMYEYDHIDFSTTNPAARDSWKTINKLSSMPSNDRFQQGVLKDILQKAGFENIKEEDLSANVLPMMRFFYLLAFVPYTIFALLGIKDWFPNTVAGYEGYVYRDAVRYVRTSARKPFGDGEGISSEVRKRR